MAKLSAIEYLRVSTNEEKRLMEKLRAVDYDRVSTDEEMQLNALVKQIQESKAVISEHGWEHVDSYVDEGKSGTTVKRRNEYQRLLRDMELNKFDIIVVKDQDRLQRNTRDWYLFVDKLISNNIQLYFYLDNKYFTPDDDALITGIKAILAEEYSRNLSKKLNNANQRRINKAKNGEDVSAMGTNMAYGHYIADGKWVIDEEQAEIVRKTFELYLELSSVRNVCRALNEMGYRNQKGRPFLEDSVRRILRNERNMGVNVLNRYHRDFNTKKIIKHPKEEWVYQENACEPIVSKEVWHKVNTIMDGKVDATNMRGKKVGNDVLSGKLFCSNCGKVLWKHSSKGYKNWYCAGYYGSGKIACDDPHRTSTVQVMKMLKNITDNLVEVDKKVVKKSIVEWLESLKKSLSIPADDTAVLKEIEKLEKQKAKLLDAYLDEIITKDAYKAKSAQLESTLEEKKKLLSPTADEGNEDIREIEAVLKNIDKEIDDYINAPNFGDSKVEFLLEHLKRITVCGKNHFIVELDLIAGAIIAGKDFFTVCNEKCVLSLTNSKFTIELKIVA